MFFCIAPTHLIAIAKFYNSVFCSPTRSSFQSGRLPVHVNDVNAVAWAEPGSSHVLYTGSDDCMCAVWDLRAPSDAARGGGPAGVLIGHTEVRPIHWSPYDRVGVVNADP